MGCPVTRWLTALAIAASLTSANVWAGDQTATPAPPAAAATTEAAAPRSGSVVSYISIPFQPMDGLGMPVVHVRINDKIDADFLVDTGSNVICVRPELGERLCAQLGLTKKTAPVAPGSTLPAGAGGDLKYISLENMKLGGRFDLRADALILDGIWNGMPTSVEGIIGGNFFSSGGSAVYIDFRHEYLDVIAKGNLSAAQVDYLGMSADYGAARIPLKSDRDGVNLFVPACVIFDGASKSPGTQATGAADHGDLLIDTGSVRTKFVSSGSGPPGPPVKTATASLPGGSIPLELFHVAAIGILGGDVSGAAASAVVLQPSALLPFVCGFASSENAHKSNIAALGIDYLSRFRVLIDYGSRMLYLMPLPHDAGVFYPTNTSRVNSQRTIEDATIGATAEGRWEIKSIGGQNIFGTAGLQIGDVIEAVNGRRTVGLFPDEVVAMLETKGARQISVSRAGKQLPDIHVPESQ